MKNLTLLTFEPYDLLLSKLTRSSDKDMEDVHALAQKLHLKFSVLLKRFNDEMTVPRREWHKGTLAKAWKDYFDPD